MQSATVHANRNSLYKNIDKDFETQRQNRHKHFVEIRKAKKEDQLLKRRNINKDDESAQESLKPTNELTIREIKTMLQSKEVNKMIEAVTFSRKQLTKLENLPIEIFFQNDVIPLLVGALSGFDDEVLIFETAWVLTNIASDKNEYTDAIVNAGAIPILINLLTHPSDKISEQTIWTLSNISGNSSIHRDMIIKRGIIPIVEDLIIRFWDKIDILRKVCWFIANLFRHKSKFYPTYLMLDLLPIIRQIMTNIIDIQCNIDLTWALAYASDGRAKIIRGLIRLDLLTVVIGNLDKDIDFVTPSLCILGNVVACSIEQADAAIKSGLVKSLAKLINHSHPRIVKETCWVASNISAGTSEHITTLVDSGLILSVLEVMKSGDYKSQKEAAWVMSNMINSTVDEHKFYLLNNNVFEAIVPMLSCNDVSVVMLLLDSIKELFTAVDKIGQLELCVEAFEKAGGIDKTEHLHNHACDEVFMKSYEILKEFIGIENEEETDSCFKFLLSIIDLCDGIDVFTISSLTWQDYFNIDFIILLVMLNIFLLFKNHY